MDDIETMLRFRGFSIKKKDPKARLIFPLGFGEEEAFYERMKHYAFRIFLRDVIKYRGSLRPVLLERYASKDTVRNYLDFLTSLGVISLQREGEYRFLREGVESFGDTFEWFVARILEREFGARASWGIRLSGPRGGGDFDVIGLLGGFFIYIETKSSPPKHIYREEVEAFLGRVGELLPSLAIFLEDTTLRMRDKILPLFQEVIEKGADNRSEYYAPFKSLRDELFHSGGRIFITNSKPDIVTNLTHCFRHFLRSTLAVF